MTNSERRWRQEVRQEMDATDESLVRIMKAFEEYAQIYRTF
jgi:hypothetical protein